MHFTLLGDAVLLAKARDAATRLLPAFDTRTGIPLAAVNLKTCGCIIRRAK